MKKIITLIIILAGLISQSFVNGVEIHQINSDGEIRTVIQDDWRQFTPLEKEAFENPGKKIFDYNISRIKRCDMPKGIFYAFIQKEANEGFLYENGKITKIQERSVIVSEPKFLYHVVALMMIILFVFISNIFYLKDKIRTASYIMCFSTMFLIAFYPIFSFGFEKNYSAGYIILPAIISFFVGVNTEKYTTKTGIFLYWLSILFFYFVSVLFLLA